ncbi:hypothetical protein [Marinomonas algicola]|uniref:hypothetical protein n=1 Tax=Marinomonas algicola TaxID=2773454 RepID=UPI00174D9776|nr:hypothetical protein [Marinomonas algicola]
MKNTLTNRVVIICLSLVSQLGMAHPGHDHSHWSSDPLHIITLVAIGSVIVGAFAYKYVIRKPKKWPHQEGKGHDI